MRNSNYDVKLYELVNSEAVVEKIINSNPRILNVLQQELLKYEKLDTKNQKQYTDETTDIYLDFVVPYLNRCLNEDPTIIYCNKQILEIEDLLNNDPALRYFYGTTTYANDDFLDEEYVDESELAEAKHFYENWEEYEAETQELINQLQSIKRPSRQEKEQLRRITYIYEKGKTLKSTYEKYIVLNAERQYHLDNPQVLEQLQQQYKAKQEEICFNVLSEMLPKYPRIIGKRYPQFAKVYSFEAVVRKLQDKVYETLKTKGYQVDQKYLPGARIKSHIDTETETF